VNGDAFGTIEGFKVAADLVSPVGGTIVQNNEFLKGWMVQGQIIEPLVNDPYNSGWIIAIQLSKPDELKALMTALQYRDLVGKK
jgi:glycine cleavage system H protein